MSLKKSTTTHAARLQMLKIREETSDENSIVQIFSESVLSLEEPK
jgi:hypothetical protein